MATLDYALLAEYARVDSAGLLTVVGGSFDRVRAAGPAAAQQVFLALRVLVDEDEDPVQIDIKVQSPGGEYELGMSGLAERNANAQPVDGRVNVMLAFGVVVPLSSAGRYVVRVALSGEVVRDLPFVVEMNQPDSP